MKYLKVFLSALLVVIGAAVIITAARGGKPQKIRVLILPKFENGEMKGDLPGEAQYYYEGYLDGGTEYKIDGGHGDSRLYVKDDVALYVTGIGKVNAAVSVSAVLKDKRFDFSDAYIISTGCGGGAVGYSTMGDVFIITSAVDYDLGHHADVRDLEEEKTATWYHDDEYDDSSAKIFNQDLAAKAYDLVKDVKPETTEKTRAFMKAAFDGAGWAVRDPKVLRGTTASGDNYWKGKHGHENALLMIKTYGCPDPFAITEMEDVSVAVALDRFGMLDRLIGIRVSVNTDAFMNGQTPEALWDPDYHNTIAAEESVEAADIFPTAMKNNYEVGKIIIDAILDGSL